MIEQFVSGGVGLLVGAIGMLIGSWFQKSRKSMCEYHMEMFGKITTMSTNFERVFEKISIIESKIDNLNIDLVKAREDIIVISARRNEKN